MQAYLGRNHCYPGGGCPRCKGVVFPNKYTYISRRKKNEKYPF